MEAALKLYEKNKGPMPDSVICIKTLIHWEKWIVLTVLTHSGYPENCCSLLSLLFWNSWQTIMWISGAFQILVGWPPIWITGGWLNGGFLSCKWGNIMVWSNGLHSFLLGDISGFKVNNTGGNVCGGLGRAGARGGDDSWAKGEALRPLGKDALLLQLNFYLPLSNLLQKSC